jgi:hypothetical protein
MLLLNPISNQVQAQVTQTLWLNKYTYHPKNLLIAYGYVTTFLSTDPRVPFCPHRKLTPNPNRSSILACFFTILAGGYAFYTSGDSSNSLFSSISRAMQGPDIAALFDSETTNPMVLEKRVAETRIRLLKDGNTERFRVNAESVGLRSM